MIMSNEDPPCFWEPYLNYHRHKELIDRLLDDDGLLPTSKLIVRPAGMGRPGFFLKDHPTVQVFPATSIGNVTRILLNDAVLWRSARLEMVAAPSIVGRVTIFGVKFQRAIEEALKQGHIKSKFQVPMPERFASTGAVAELIVHVGVDVEDGIRWATLEAWQDVPQSSEAFYVHARIHTTSGLFVHLDGATIQYDPESKAQLFNSGVKLKGHCYQKHFRVDGTIQESIAFEISKAFFPIEELADEYFVDKIWDGPGDQRGGRLTSRPRRQRADRG